MNFIDALAQPRVLLACVVFGILNLLLARTERKFMAAMRENPATDWLADVIYLPLARVFCVLVFLGIAYPAVFGLTEAPNLFTLLDAEDRRTSNLINFTFLLSLLLPWLPVLGRLPSLVLPLQGLLASAMLFSWLALARGIEAQLWPGWTTAGLVLVWLIVGQRLAVWLAQQIGDSWRQSMAGEDMDQVFYESAVLFFQVPAILMYTVQLGEQVR